MKKLLKILMLNGVLVLMASYLSFSHAETEAGDWAGSGGDALKCDLGNGKFSYEVLDSYEMKKYKKNTFRHFANSNDAMEAIIEKLRFSVPNFGENLATFYKNFERGEGTTEVLKIVHARGWSMVDIDVFWLAEPHGLNQLNDANVAGKYPENCEEVQLVNYRRKDLSGVRNDHIKINDLTRKYYYDSFVMDEIKNTNDQLSWILVHEFGWDYFDSAEDIREFNAYLHSEKFFKADSSLEDLIKSKTIRKRLLRMGIDYDHLDCPDYDSVCEKLHGVRLTQRITGIKLVHNGSLFGYFDSELYFNRKENYIVPSSDEMVNIEGKEYKLEMNGYHDNCQVRSQVVVEHPKKDNIEVPTDLYKPDFDLTNIGTFREWIPYEEIDFGVKNEISLKLCKGQEIHGPLFVRYDSKQYGNDENGECREYVMVTIKRTAN